MGSAAKLIVDALLQRFIPLARRRIETTQFHVRHLYPTFTRLFNLHCLYNIKSLLFDEIICGDL